MTRPVVPAVFHVRRARDLIDRHFAEPLDLDAMARAAGFSRYHFARAFKAAYGETPGQYLTRRRVERAQDLLRNAGGWKPAERAEPAGRVDTGDGKPAGRVDAANLTVTEICHLVGFASLGSFSARFTELVGASPTEYRRRYAERGAPYVPGCFLMAWSRPRGGPGSASSEKVGPALQP
jgi:AraC-like DNA-binding protein